MIIVHDIFICKPGNASKLAKMFKEEMKDEKNISIMTDVTGQYNRVIMASWYDDLSAYVKAMEAYMQPSPEKKESSNSNREYQEMYLTGMREIYRTW